MTRAKLMKAIMLGVCVSAFSSNIAFAQMTTAVESTALAVTSDEQITLDQALVEKQSEIDQYIFTDHAKEIEEKGIFVSYTAVTEDAVEVGISPFTDENANYFYEIFGKDAIRVVEFDESVIYQTTIAEPAVVDGEPAVVDAELAVVDVEAAVADADTAVVDVEPVVADAETSAVDAAPEKEEVYTTMIEQETATDDTIVYAVDNKVYKDELKRGSEDAPVGSSVPMTVLAIAAGTAVIGGTVIVSAKKKKTK